MAVDSPHRRNLQLALREGIVRRCKPFETDCKNILLVGIADDSNDDVDCRTRSFASDDQIGRSLEPILYGTAMRRSFHLNERESDDEIESDDLFAKYDELLRLRQLVKIAECGRAIGPAGLIDLASDPLETLTMNRTSGSSFARE